MANIAKKKPVRQRAPRPRRTLLETLRAHPRVEFADDLRDCGDGIFVTLREGFSFEDDDDARCRGEDTVSEALRQVRQYSEPYPGPYHD